MTTAAIAAPKTTHGAAMTRLLIDVDTASGRRDWV
jgi:hypothetical protein